MRTIRRLIVHHSASAETTSAATIDRWHRARGWASIGYHYVVRRLEDEGVWIVEPGRDEDTEGAHAKGRNADSIGVCLCGDYTRGPVHPDAWTVLVATVASLCRRYALDAGAIEGHGEGSATACPGYDPADLRADVARQLARAA